MTPSSPRGNVAHFLCSLSLSIVAELQLGRSPSLSNKFSIPSGIQVRRCRSTHLPKEFWCGAVSVVEPCNPRSSFVGILVREFPVVGIPLVERLGGGSRDSTPWCSWEPPSCGVASTLCKGCATLNSTLSGEVGTHVWCVHVRTR